MSGDADIGTYGPCNVFCRIDQREVNAFTSQAGTWRFAIDLYSTGSTSAVEEVEGDAKHNAPYTLLKTSSIFDSRPK